MSSALERSWYRRRGWSLALAPLSGLYGAVVAVRRHAYARGWLRSVRVAVPVVVIGNVSVGGNGKTPLTAYTARCLCQRGLRVGIVSRGYGGQAEHYPLTVTQDVSAAQAGDEPVLLAARGDATVVVDPVRVRGAQALVAEHDVDVIIADDGLQHYALQRDVEIVVVDAERGHGNGWLLPAGPLREPRRRIDEADVVLYNGASGDFTVVPEAARRIDGGGRAETLASFAGQRVHAVAGIGAPQRFFDMLRGYGMMVFEHAFADHHAFTAADIDFNDDKPVVMTEKDAVKCRAWVDRRHWFVPVDVRFESAGQQRLEAALETLLQRMTRVQGDES